MITRIEAYRYRCFEQIDVELGSYNVLVGANGSGKTMLLDVPALLGDLMRRRLASAAFLESPRSELSPRAHTLRELIHRERGDDFGLAVEARLPERIVSQLVGMAPAGVRNDRQRWPSHLRYELGFQLCNHVELRVRSEHLVLFAENGQRPPHGTGLRGGDTDQRDWQRIVRREAGGVTRFASADQSAAPLEFRIADPEAALPSLPPDSEKFPAGVWFQELLREGSVFYEPNWPRLRTACPPGSPHGVIASGVNLPWLVLRLQSEDPQLFGDWVDHVRTALPEVRSILAREREEDHHAYLEVFFEDGLRVTSSGLSEGTLRILALTIIPYLSRPPRLLITEEPENGIHPQGIETVLQSLRSLYDEQVWFSSHSPIVLAHTDLANLLCMQMNPKGYVTVTRGDQHPRLHDRHQSMDLGRLFATGVLG